MTPDDAPPDGAASGPRSGWTFLTNHGHVLLTVAAQPDIRVADIASGVGITPRATLLILRDLQDDGYLTRERVGRRTHYTVAQHRPFRHPRTRGAEVDQLLAIFASVRGGVSD